MGIVSVQSDTECMCWCVCKWLSGMPSCLELPLFSRYGHVYTPNMHSCEKCSRVEQDYFVMADFKSPIQEFGCLLLHCIDFKICMRFPSLEQNVRVRVGKKISDSSDQLDIMVMLLTEHLLLRSEDKEALDVY